MHEKSDTNEPEPAEVAERAPSRGTLGDWATQAQLIVETTAGETRVFVDALVVARFPANDMGARNLAMVNLAQGGSFTAARIAAAFGVTHGRVSQLRKRFHEGGAAKLTARRGAPRGQRTLSPKQIERVRELRRTGCPIDDIWAVMTAKQVCVGRSTIARVVKGIVPRTTADLPFETPSQRAEVKVDAAATGAEALPTLEAACMPAEQRDGHAPCGEGHVGVTVNQGEAVLEADASVTVELENSEVPDSTDANATAIASTAIAQESGAAQVVEAPITSKTIAQDSGTSDLAETPPTFKVLTFGTAPRECRVAGAMVAHVAFEALGFRRALEASGAALRPARTFDLLRTAGVLLFGILLRYRSVEALRMLVRDDFAALLDIERAPEVRTVQRKLAELTRPETGFNGTHFVRGLGESLIRDAAVPDGVYFFDDHFARYHGKQPFGKGHDAKSRLGVPGREDIYVHDRKGRAVLFVPLPAPTSLSKAMPLALQELRAIHAIPRLAVFDRGGWSKALFRELVSPKEETGRVDFLTYLTARNKPRELPDKRFKSVEVKDAGRIFHYDVAELPFKLAGVDKPLRIIVLRDAKTKRQIPILTSVPKEAMAAGDAVHLLRSRWRQENSFKYLVGELAIDAFVARDVDLVTNDRLVDNPEAEEIKVELENARSELAKCESAISKALLNNVESRRRTVRGLKIANADALRRHKEAATLVATLEEDLAGTPKRVPLVELDPQAQRATERTQRRLFISGLKLLVHNAEKWLADRIGPGPYGRHALPIIRALSNQGGTIRRDGDRLIVDIRPLDTPRYQRHVDQLLAALNERQATFLDSGLQLEFRTLTPGE